VRGKIGRALQIRKPVFVSPISAKQNHKQKIFSRFYRPIRSLCEGIGEINGER